MYQIDYKRPEHQIVIDLIMLDNPGYRLEVDDVDFDLPVEIVDPPVDLPRNASVRLTALPTSNYLGSNVYFYNRVDINDFTYNGLLTPSDLQLTVQYELTTQQLYPKLSALLGCTITPSMIVYETLPVVPNGELVPVTIRMNPLNWVITGEMQLHLKR